MITNFVHVKPIPKTSSATNITEMRNETNGVSGKKLNKTKYTKDCLTGITALYSPAIGGLKTGLYKIKEGTDITLQEWAENNWNLSKGYLTNRYKNLNPSEGETYFQTKSWKLGDKTTILYLDNLDDWCLYQVLLESKYCANSEKEWKAHQWPKAEFYIALENESESIRYNKNILKTQASAALHSTELTPSYKNKLVVLLGLGSSRNIYTEENIHNMLVNYIMDEQKYKSKYKAEILMEYVNKLKTPEGKIDFENEYFLQQLVDYRIVSEKASTYTWLSKGMDLGYTKVETLDFLKNPKKQSLIKELENEIEVKKIT